MKRLIRYLLLAPLFLALTGPLSQAQDNKQLEKRLNSLEKKVNNSLNPENKGKNVQSFLDTNLTIGGFFETAITGLASTNRAFQTASSTNILGVNLGAEFSDNLRFVAQWWAYFLIPVSNPNSDPRAVGVPPQAQFSNFATGNLLTQSYVEWSESDAFNIEGGMGYVPYGIIFQQLELVLFERRLGPQLLRTNTLVFPIWQGLNIHGSFPLMTGRWGYNVYTFSSPTNAGIPGVGGRLSYNSAEENFTFGVSNQTSKRGGLTHHSLGMDIRYHLDPVTITAEAAKSFGEGPQPWSFYIQPDIDLYKQIILLFAFADYLDNPLNTTGAGATAVSDAFQKWEYGMGLNWLPTSFTRIRFTVTRGDYIGPTAIINGQNRDNWNFDLSAGVAF